MIRTSNSNKNFGLDIKIIIVGNSNSGKTSFVKRWIKNSFVEYYKATILSEFNSKIIEKRDKIYRVHIWDIAGQDRSAVLTKIFCKDCHGALILSDITDPNSLKDVLIWKESINNNITASQIPIILIENKSDLKVPDSIGSSDKFTNFGEKNNFSGCFRTSAKTGFNVNESMDFLINLIIGNLDKGVFERDRHNSIILDRTFIKYSKKNNCC